LVEGFNIGVTGTDTWYQDGISAYSKIGITLNNEANCNSNDAGIGFGMYNSYPSYEPHPCGAFKTNKKYTRIGYILGDYESPSAVPTLFPSSSPSAKPTPKPSPIPTPSPSAVSTLVPSSIPSALPSPKPSPISVTTCSGKADGIYTIVTASTSFSGYCYDSYLLLAKLNGALSTWSYSNAIWYDTTTYNPESLLMDTTTEAKLTAYNSFPINRIRIGMTSDTVANAVFSDITLPTSYASLQALFSANSSFDTSLGLTGSLRKRIGNFGK
jgi:hypothetical protein